MYFFFVRKELLWKHSDKLKQLDEEMETRRERINSMESRLSEVSGFGIGLKIICFMREEMVFRPHDFEQNLNRKMCKIANNFCFKLKC